MEKKDQNQAIKISELKEIKPIEGTYWMRGTMAVHINNNPLSGDVFDMGDVEVEGKKYKQVTISRTVYDRIATSAGLSVMARRLDDGMNREFAHFEAIALMQGATGQVQAAKGSSAMSMDDFREEVRLALDKEISRYGHITLTWKKENGKSVPDKTCSKGSPEFEAEYNRRLEGRLAQRRANLAAHCETRARKRAIRAALGLKSLYLQSELSKPLEVQVTVLNTEKLLASGNVDQETKKLVTATMMGGVSALFGNITGSSKALPEQSSNQPYRIDAPPPPEQVEVINGNNGNGDDEDIDPETGEITKKSESDEPNTEPVTAEDENLFK